MITLTGKSVFGGVSIGKIAFYKRNEQQIKRWHVDDTESEVKRFEDAKAKAVAELQELYQKAMSDVGETNAMIFEFSTHPAREKGSLTYWTSKRRNK